MRVLATCMRHERNAKILIFNNLQCRLACWSYGPTHNNAPTPLGTTWEAFLWQAGKFPLYNPPIGRNVAHTPPNFPTSFAVYFTLTLLQRHDSKVLNSKKILKMLFIHLCGCACTDLIAKSSCLCLTSSALHTHEVILWLNSWVVISEFPVWI